SPSIHERYTFWSGLLGGTFLMLSYFGTDQSQIQRYISGHSLRESRLGLLFNAVCKIPMQFCILLLGVLMFVYYQFEQPPLFFDSAANRYVQSQKTDPKLTAYQNDFAVAHTQVMENLETWIQARHHGDRAAEDASMSAAVSAQQQGEKIRLAATEELGSK